MSSSIAGGGVSSGTGSTPGLGEGIDVNQFVQLALAYDQARITNLQNQQNSLSTQSQVLAQITSDLNAVQSATKVLKDPLGALNLETATASNASILSASATTGAVAGVHTISISKLATTSSYYTDAVASSSTNLAAGDTISVSVGGNQVASVTLDSTSNTMDQLAAAINAATKSVSASVINDANGARLALVSAATGLPGDISVSGILHLTDSQSTAVNFHQAVAGLNAALSVDGVPISSASNTVSGVINGVTLNLTAPTGTDAITLTVAPDTSSATNAVNQFVSAYNRAIQDINSQYQVNADGSGGGALQADGSLREAQQLLLSAISYSTSGSNGPLNLATLGINMNDDATLTVDASALSTALSSNRADLLSFFQTATTGFAANINTVLQNLTDVRAGVLGADATSLTQSFQGFSQQILRSAGRSYRQTEEPYKHLRTG